MASTQPSVAEVVCSPEVSAEDKRKYRYVRLPNKLECLLVSDPDTEKAAAALDVYVGALSDPNNLPGLSHFLEHMLFLGTEKYPDESSYNEFLSAHGGFDNAYTSSQHTNYHFSVSSTALRPALDRFAQFFIAPLFTPSATDREVNAVNNEHMKNLQTDSRRLYQLKKHLVPSSHPYNKFSTGNADTLHKLPAANGVDVRAALLQHHKKYYSADIMKLCMVGREPLDTLQTWAEEMFAAVPAKGITPPQYAEHGNPLTHIVGRQVRVVPVKDFRQLKVMFPLPPIHEHYRSQPARGLGHLIGHEAAGSVFSVLKDAGLVNSLSAGASSSSPAWAQCTVSMTLTEAGLAQTDTIIKVLFSYIELLKAMDEAEWKRTFDEMRAVSAMNFRFKGKETPYNYATSVADAMHDHKPEHVLSHGYLFPEFNHQQVARLVNSLTPDNFFYFVISKTFEDIATESETWYGVKYKADPLAEDLLASLRDIRDRKSISINVREQKQSVDPEPFAAVHTAVDQKDSSDWRGLAGQLALPVPNVFIATDFSLKVPDVEELRTKREAELAALRALNAEDSDKATEEKKVSFVRRAVALYKCAPAPHLLVNEAHARVWYRPDEMFFKPKLYVTSLLYSDIPGNNSARASVLRSLFAQLVEDLLSAHTYNADIAGLHFAVDANRAGLLLDFYGYSEKIGNLLDLVCKQIASFTDDVKEDRFKVLKEKLARQYRNFAKQQPYQHASFFQTVCREQMVFLPSEMLTEIENISYDDVRVYAARFLSRVFVDALVYGNAKDEQAKALTGNLIDLVGTAKSPLPASQRYLLRARRFERNTAYYYRTIHTNPDDVNSCMKMYLEVGEDNAHDRNMLRVFAHVVRTKCFDILRTKEQLGYLVWSGQSTLSGVTGFTITVQSSTHDADYLEGRAEAFLHALLEKILPELSDEEFTQHQEAVMEDIIQQPKSPGRQASRYWAELSRQRLQFNRRSENLEALGKLTKDGLIAFANKYIKLNSPHRSKLVVQVFSATHRESTLAQGTAPPSMVSGQFPAIKRVDKDEKDSDAAKEKDAADVEFNAWPPKDEAHVVHIDDFYKLGASLPLYPAVWASQGDAVLSRM